MLAFTFDGRFRLDLYIDSGDRDANKRMFNGLRIASQDVQPPAGSTIEWQVLEDARASRVALYYPSPIEVWSSEEEHARLADWVRETVPWFCTTMTERYRVIAQRA